MGEATAMSGDILLWRQLQRFGEIEEGDAPTVENEFDTVKECDDIFLRNLLRVKTAPRIDRVVSAQLVKLRQEVNMVPEEYRAEYDAAREALVTSGILSSVKPTEAKKQRTVAALDRAKKQRSERMAKKIQRKERYEEIKEVMKVPENNEKVKRSRRSRK